LRRACLSLLVLAALALGSTPAVTAEARFRVIVHPQVKGSRISRGALTSIFLGQVAKWGDGSSVLPVDQSIRSSVRVSFSGDVLQQGLVEIQIYWQRRIASGATPPPVKPSDEEVVAYVASNPGAIGYVSVATPLPGSVKAIEITQ
jgi:ABC-type phosphate transport system substrate-binding protein